MSQFDNRVLPSERGSRLIRGLVVVFVVVLVVGGAYLVLSQMTNRLTLVNDSPQPMKIGRIVLKSKDHSSGEWRGSAPLVADRVMQPNTRLTLTYSGRRHGRVIVLKQWSSNERSMKAIVLPVSWGYRTTTGWNAKNEDILESEPSTLRWLFNSISPWLPLPASWRE